MTTIGDELLVAKRAELAQKDLLVDLTKDELYDLAQSSGVEGRSAMTKAQLVEALQD